MITQVYQFNTERWIEITNISASETTLANTVNVILYSDRTGDQTGITPTDTFIIPSALSPGQSVIIKSSSSQIGNINAGAVLLIDNDITNFVGANDIITLSSQAGTSSWANRYDMIAEFGDKTSYVRIDETLVPNVTYTTSEWVVFVDPALDPYRVLASGGPERHPHDPLTSEITGSDSQANTLLGLHRITPTNRTGSIWNNGYPDRSRSVFIRENYEHTVNRLSARKLEVTLGNILAVTDNLLVVTNEISLFGSQIRLVGTSQLIQTHTLSTQITASNGSALLVDRYSEVPSLYRYNYMSSPVNTSNALSTYTLQSIFKDGTTPLDATTAISTVAKDINFVGGFDGAATNPITLAEYWIYTYAPGNGDRSNWLQKFENGTIPQTDGYIFKGPGRAQNYTFVGTPKDGNLSTADNNGGAGTNVGGFESYLVGNPYASSISVQKFIEDNINSIDGTLYFWTHDENSNEGNIGGHTFRGYTGGYATRSIDVGVAADSQSNTSNDNNGTGGIGSGDYKVPSKYIAIAQGFFVTGDIDGGPIVFNNSQREYILEGDTNNDAVYFKQGKKSKKTVIEDITNNVPILKLGIDFRNEETVWIHRQIGISFRETNSFAYEKGYDSSIYALGDNDMYWEFDNDESNYIIAGVQSISDDLEVPLSITIVKSQFVKLSIDEWQNVDRDVYIYDNLTETQYKVNDSEAVIHLEEGDHKNRFFMTFEESANLSTDTKSSQNLVINYSKNDNIIKLTCLNGLALENAKLIDLKGNSLYNWENSLDGKSKHNLNVSTLKTGVYILRIRTNYGIIAKKIIIH
jgi:hypothetical protein